MMPRTRTRPKTHTRAPHRRTVVDDPNIRELARPAEAICGQPGLALMLACREVMLDTVPSRVATRRVGPLGLDPLTAKIAELGKPVTVLTDPRWAIAFATWQIARMRSLAVPFGQLDWFAVSRGLVEPRLVADTAGRSALSQYADGGLLQALSYLGESPRFAKALAFGEGYRWPGMPDVLEALGVKEGST